MVTLYYQHYTACKIKYVFRKLTGNLNTTYILNEDKLISLGEP